jgi:hypothetical protein
MNYKINFYFNFIFINFTFLKRKDMNGTSYDNILWEKHLSTNRE